MYSIKDLMTMYSMSERSIRRYLSEGAISGTKVGGVWRFTEEDMESFFTEKRVKSKMKNEVNKLLYDFISTPNPKKNDSHCFSMIDIRLSVAENLKLLDIIFKIISDSNNIQMRYYHEDGNCRYILIGDLDFIETITNTINIYIKKAAN